MALQHIIETLTVIVHVGAAAWIAAVAAAMFLWVVAACSALR